MMTPVDPVLDADLDAYVDDQLGVARRIEVEAFLSTHPDQAARVMADLSLKGELRLALAEAPSYVRIDTREAARKLEAALSRRRVLSRFGRAAAAAVLIAAGWLAHSEWGVLAPSRVSASVPPPPYVEEAIRAHRTTLLREEMPSQRAASGFDPDEIRAATAILLPQLPERWKVLDVQVYPSANGPSVEMAVLDGSDRQMSLFAERPGRFAVTPLTAYGTDEARAAYWQSGEVAFALVGSQLSEPELVADARPLAAALP